MMDSLTIHRYTELFDDDRVALATSESANNEKLRVTRQF